MKKILASLAILLMLINVGVYVFADEAENTQQPTQSTTEKVSATLKMTEEVKAEEGSKEIKIKIAYGEIKGLSEGGLISYQGILKYSDEYFEKLTQDSFKAESGYTVVYSQENNRIIVEATKTPKSNEDTLEITLKLKENVKDITTSVELNLEEFTDSENDFELQPLKTNVIVTSTKENSNKTESTKDDQNNNTESTKDDNKEELEILPGSSTTQTTKTENETKDTTVSQEKELPKTGVTTVALIILAVILVGILSLVRYKNIEIK